VSVGGEFASRGERRKDWMTSVLRLVLLTRFIPCFSMYKDKDGGKISAPARRQQLSMHVAEQRQTPDQKG
jgi:hypothetical protein